MRTSVIAALSVVLAVAPVHAACTGDCHGDGEVTINELILGVTIALGTGAVTDCNAMDVNQDGQVTVNELVSAVNAALTGCSTPAPTPTPTAGPVGTQRIVYSASDLAAGDIADIFVINTDGTGMTKIFHATGADTNPAWSPDGTRIAFSTAYKTGYGIAVMNADGSGVQVLTTEDSPLNYHPAWSPDGSQITFTVGSGDGIDIMNADGSNRHRLVTQSVGEAYGHMSWCPDGSLIAFESTRPRQAGAADRVEIWVMTPDGTNFVRLTTNDVEDHHPDWSPDTQTILFGRAGLSAGVYSIRPNGSDEKRLISDPFWYGTPAPNWSRDGQQIAYGSLFGLKIANAVGANASTVPNTQFIADFDLK